MAIAVIWVENAIAVKLTLVGFHSSNIMAQQHVMTWKSC